MSNSYTKHKGWKFKYLTFFPHESCVNEHFKSNYYTFASILDSICHNDRSSTEESSQGIERDIRDLARIFRWPHPSQSLIYQPLDFILLLLFLYKTVQFFFFIDNLALHKCYFVKILLHKVYENNKFKFTTIR